MHRKSLHRTKNAKNIYIEQKMSKIFTIFYCDINNPHSYVNVYKDQICKKNVIKINVIVYLAQENMSS